MSFLPHGRRTAIIFTICLMAAWLGALWPTLALADPGAAGLSAQQMAVRELMRLETSAALHHARRQQKARQRPGDGISAPAVIPQERNLALLAIYGVGRKLLARVLHGGKTYIYMRGQVLPVGVSAARGKSVFRLQGMSSGCVELRREDQSRTLCLHPTLLSGG